tara:strand:- start:3779 stop:4936 length:1158 start_codon:yes stop_codon:yes gene_type:complete
MIPYGRQDITDEDIEAVNKVLRSNFLTQGDALPLFERNICEYTGAKFALGVNSGTSALHLACRALGLSKGDILWTTAITFASSANCALFCGADVDFIDIDEHDWNLSLQKLKEKLEIAALNGKLPKILVVVHFAGLPCRMKDIKEICDSYGISIIEDACHALGAKYQNESIGSCRYSDVVTFSFHPVKSITTGEGGMVLTNSKKIASKVGLLRSHGITRDPSLMSKDPDGPWFNEQIDLGFNYRMTEVQAALGDSQLNRLDDYMDIRNKIGSKYRDELSDLPLNMQMTHEDSFSSNHLFVIRLISNQLRKTHLEVFNDLLSNGIGINLHYMPVYRHFYYERIGYSKQLFPESEKYYQEAISLPIFPLLNDQDQSFVIKTLRKILV